MLTKDQIIAGLTEQVAETTLERDQAQAQLIQLGGTVTQMQATVQALQDDLAAAKKAKRSSARKRT